MQFRRPPQDWEEEAFDRFMGLVYSSTVRGFGPDKICWKPARNKGFEVRDYYNSFYPPTRFLSMENDMTIEGSSKGGFLFLVCFLR